MPQLIDNLLSVRTNISSIFIRRAIRHFPDRAREVLKSADDVEDQADAYTELDYRIFRGLAFASGNPIYGLILNGLKGSIPASAATIFPTRKRARWRCVLSAAADLLRRHRTGKHRYRRARLRSPQRRDLAQHA